MARVGAIITPFVATLLLQRHFYVTVCVYGGIAIVSGMASFLLPYETKGRNLGAKGNKKLMY